MKPARLPLLLGLLLGAGQALAAPIDDTRWGMTPDEVIAVMGGGARAYVAPNAQQRPGMTIRLRSQELSGGREAETLYYFDERTGGLARIDVRIPGGFEACQSKREKITATFGPPFDVSGGPGDGWINGDWNNDTIKGRMRLQSIGEDEEASCTLAFMDAANAVATAR